MCHFRHFQVQSHLIATIAGNLEIAAPLTCMLCHCAGATTCGSPRTAVRWVCDLLTGILAMNLQTQRDSRGQSCFDCTLQRCCLWEIE
jgi:hypothetical protein